MNQMDEKTRIQKDIVMFEENIKNTKIQQNKAIELATQYYQDSKYYLEKKDYFFSKKKPKFSILDKVFISVIYLFYFFSILMIIALGFEIYKSSTFIIDTVADEIINKDLDDSLDICNQKQGDNRDICMIAAIASHKREIGVDKYCSDVESAFYRFTCYQTLI